MIISLCKVLKINKLHIRRKHKLNTSYFTPYIDIYNLINLSMNGNDDDNVNANENDTTNDCK